MSDRQELDQPFQPRKHKQDDNELDITPMIDIVFLLLSFFVVASKFDPSSAVPIPPARFGGAVTENNCVCLLIFEGTDADNPAIFRGRSRSEADQFKSLEPTVLEEEVARYVDDEISKRPNVEGILIKAAGEVKSGIVQIVQRGVSQSDMAEGKPLYIGVEESD